MPTTDRALTRRGVLTALGLAGVGAAAAACTSKKQSWNEPGGNGSEQAEKDGKATVTITTPEADAKNVPAGVDIVFKTTDAASTQVTLTDSGGAEVAGAMHPDGASWLPK